MSNAGVCEHRNALGTTARALLLAGALAGAPLLALSPQPALAAMPDSFADLLEDVSPAVVQITAKSRDDESARMHGPQGMPLPDEFPEGPFRDFFERFFQHGLPGQRPGTPDGQGRPGPGRAALGSGFIVSADGTVVTNNHVIGGAQSIEVTLKDGRSFPATLVGTDEKTDLAVLRIDADKPLPTVTWGDSDRARVGDWVVAVGNPFGLSGTATAGIVSSRGRDIGAGPYDDFIQIDAPINTGNSGGPLFDGGGKVIGVNTAIYTPNGGSVGIGFAIPSNIAQKIVADLQTKGSVERGWLGIAIQPVTPDVAESLGLATAEGALVADVTKGSPAAAAGLRPGDVVLRYDTRAIETPRELSRAVADTDVDTAKKLTVWRNGREETLEVQVGEMPQRTAAASPAPATNPDQAPGSVQLAALGLTLAPLDASARDRFGLNDQTRGAVVAAVDGDADAAAKGVRVGDVITRVNLEAVTSPEDVARAVGTAQKAQRKSILLLVERNGEQRFVAVELARA